MVGELFGAESMTQVYAFLHTFLHQNEESLMQLSKYTYYAVHRVTQVYSTLRGSRGNMISTTPLVLYCSYSTSFRTFTILLM